MIGIPCRRGQAVSGLIVDVGCGPGQCTGYLAGHHADIEGVDPVPEFIEIARTTYPGVTYRLGSADNLGIEDGGPGGVLAWYSFIHTEPNEIDDALNEFARCLCADGSLLIGFFEGPELESLDWSGPAISASAT